MLFPSSSSFEPQFLPPLTTNNKTKKKSCWRKIKLPHLPDSSNKAEHKESVAQVSVIDIRTIFLWFRVLDWV
jgi:hypothetical protein